MSTALTLYQIEDDLRALVDTLEGGVEEDQRLAILDAIAERTEQGVAKCDNVIRLLRWLGFILDTDRRKGIVGAVDREIDRLKAWKVALEARRVRIEAYVVRVIEQCVPEPKRGPKKLEGSLGVLALHKNPDKVGDDIDMDALPVEYQEVTVTLPAAVWKRILTILDALPDVPLDEILKDYEPGMFGQKFTPRKADILRDLKAGRDIPGADLRFGDCRLEVR